MVMRQLRIPYYIQFLVLWLAVACLPIVDPPSDLTQGGNQLDTLDKEKVSLYSSAFYTDTFRRTVPMADYFFVIDSLVIAYDSLTLYPLNEHLLLQANPHFIDSLAHTDYYWQQAHGNFVYDQQAMPIFRPGDKLMIPDTALARELQAEIDQYRIDVNVPEFVLRIYEGETLRHQFPVRVGKNQKGYIGVVGHITNWQTRTGTGFIANRYRMPVFENLQTGKEYVYTRRDDQKLTLMPKIPTLEPEIDGVCYGQLIHATTNPATLGRPASHGCIGTREGDAWRIYYHAPLGTKVIIRYDLEVIDSTGATLILPDIYLRE